MELEKYKNDGWGLSKKQLNELLGIIKDFKSDKIRVLEFGSGKSTEFLVDVVLNKIKSIEITSFDDNIEYAYNGNYEFLDLKIRQLLECDDKSYELMFNNLSIDSNLLHKKITPLTSRQKNNFYEILPGDISGTYELMILDGPNGNGRNLSFLHVKNHLTINSIVLVDDFNHYDFMQRLSLLFEYEVIYENQGGGVDQWNTGGNYKIVKITKLKF
jgi:hypothetical protein